MFNVREWVFTLGSTIRSGVLGFFIGVLPGAGASVASAVAYANEKRHCEGKDPNAKFGQGDLRGLTAPEAANNGSATGSFIPMLTLGVPGSGTTAVMMGALSLYNITPGPVLFDSNPSLVWGLIASLFIANVMLLFMNIPMVRVFASMLRIPPWLLVPCIVVISFVGVYALHSATFDLGLAVGVGVVGYFLRKMGVPLAPLVLGVVLGNLMEQNLRRALSITNGELFILWESSMAKGLWAASLMIVVVPWLYRKLRSTPKNPNSP